MKLCIPTETQDGKQAKVHSHFGSAPYFVIYDTDSETSDVIDNPNQHHVHGACHPMMALSGRKISAAFAF